MSQVPQELRDEIPSFEKQAAHEEHGPINWSALTSIQGARSFEEIQHLAHKSAGASATCGMNAIVPHFRELERQGYEGKLSGAPALLARAGKELERIRTFLNNRRRS